MQFTDSSHLRNTLLLIEPKRFVSRYLFEPVPHAFRNDLDLWVSWKEKLSAHLEIDPYEIVLTGSGAIGYSLNPKNNYKAFHKGSDIDVGVISLHHFELAWRYLRKTRPEWLSLPARTHRALQAHRKNYVFSGTIATDIILPLLPFGRSWQGGLDDMAAREPTKGRDVKLRIYRDYEALRAYQAHGIERLRNELLDLSDIEADIPVEED